MAIFFTLLATASHATSTPTGINYYIPINIINNQNTPPNRSTTVALFMKPISPAVPERSNVPDWLYYAIAAAITIMAVSLWLLLHGRFKNTK